MDLQKIEARRGNTALHSSFQHLSSPHSTWKTTLVGWTGKIQRIAEDRKSEHKKNFSQSSSPAGTPANQPEKFRTPATNLRAGSIPKPGLLRRTTTFGTPTREPEEVLRIGKLDREVLEEKLWEKKEDKFGAVVPVWLGDEEDEGNSGLTVGDDWERWNMFSQKGMSKFVSSQYSQLINFDILKSFGRYYIIFSQRQQMENLSVNGGETT